MKAKDLVEKVLEGNMIGIARASTYVENELRGYKTILKKIKKYTGNAHVVGITGFPGSGKSTLIKCLIEEYLDLNKKIGVVAVDPSALSGGAGLGDRKIISQSNKIVLFYERIYIRSLSSRGRSGGLAKNTGNIVKVLDAAGYDKIFVETVGAGQNDVDIVNLAHTSIVVVNPGMGDLQISLKGGIMEIADIYVINKADYPDVPITESNIRQLIQEVKRDWKPLLFKTVSRDNEGIKELVDGIEEHYKYIRKK